MLRGRCGLIRLPLQLHGVGGAFSEVAEYAVNEGGVWRESAGEPTGFLPGMYGAVHCDREVLVDAISVGPQIGVRIEDRAPIECRRDGQTQKSPVDVLPGCAIVATECVLLRSEERRVGKECRDRGWS